MADLMVGDNTPLFHAEDTVLFLLADENDLNCFKQVLLAYLMASVLNGQNRSLIDHIGKIRTDRAARGK